MSKANLLTMSVALGVAVGSLGISLPTLAIQLYKVTPTPTQTPPEWTNLGWKVEGRAGADPKVGSSQDDYEIAIGPNGAQADYAAIQHWQWEDDVDVNWSLNWDGSTVTFQFDGLDPISYKPSDSTNVFNGFYLLTKSQTLSKPNDPKTFVDPGTTIDFLVKTVNGESVIDQFGDTLLSSATSPAPSGQMLTQPYFYSDEAISSMTGTVKMSWLNRNPQVGNGRSYVDFQIRGFNTGAGVSVPEPASTFSLLAFGAIGVGSLVGRKQKMRAENCEQVRLKNN